MPGTQPATAASSPSRAPPLIAPLRAYKRLCFVSHIIPVISPVPTDKVKVLAETTGVIVNVWWCHGSQWLFVYCKHPGWPQPFCQSQQLSWLCFGPFDQHKSRRWKIRKITLKPSCPAVYDWTSLLAGWKENRSGSSGAEAVKEVHVWPSFTLFVSSRPKAMLWVMMVDWHKERTTFTESKESIFSLRPTCKEAANK